MELAEALDTIPMHPKIKAILRASRREEAKSFELFFIFLGVASNKNSVKSVGQMKHHSWNTWITLLGIAILCFSPSVAGAQLEVPEKPSGYVSDPGQQLDPKLLQAISDVLVSHDRLTQEKIFLAVINEGSVEDLQSYSQRLTETWGIDQVDGGTGMVIALNWSDENLGAFAGYGFDPLLGDFIPGKSLQSQWAESQGNDPGQRITKFIVALLNQLQSPIFTKSPQPFKQFIVPDQGKPSSSMNTLFTSTQIVLGLLFLMFTFLLIQFRVSPEVRAQVSGWKKTKFLEWLIRKKIQTKDSADEIVHERW
jgi:uncharacterized membrane protein YgcG